MGPKRFVAPDFGRAVRTRGRHGYVAFQPGPMPRAVDLGPDTVLRLSDADRALGRLAGTGRLLVASMVNADVVGTRPGPAAQPANR